MAQAAHCDVLPVDLGIAGAPVPGVRDCRIAAGTACVGQHWTADCAADGSIILREDETITL